MIFRRNYLILLLRGGGDGRADNTDNNDNATPTCFGKNVFDLDLDLNSKGESKINVVSAFFSFFKGLSDQHSSRSSLIYNKFAYSRQT